MSQLEIAHFKARLAHRRLDVQAEALLALSAIAGATETPLYIQLLDDATFRQKALVMRVIDDAADARAVPAVLRYACLNAQKLRARRRNPLRARAADETLARMASYLSRFQFEHPEVRPVIRELAALSPHATHAILPKIP